MLVGWIFGIDKFFKCVTDMDLNLKPFIVKSMKVCIRIICPIACVGLFAASLYGYITNYKENNIPVVRFKCSNGTNEDQTYQLPKESEVLSWMIELSTVCSILVFGVWAIVKKFKNGINWKALFQTSEEWRSAEEEDLKGVAHF